MLQTSMNNFLKEYGCPSFDFNDLSLRREKGSDTPGF